MGVGKLKVSKEMRKWVGVSHWWPLRVRMGWLEDVWVLACLLAVREETCTHTGRLHAGRHHPSINTAAAIVTE